jgi:hypothetical protein
VAAPLSTITQAEEVLWKATEMLNAIRGAKDFGDLKLAVTLFIASLDFVVLGDEDLLDLAAKAVVDRGKSVNLALKRKQHESELLGETVSK